MIKFKLPGMSGPALNDSALEMELGGHSARSTQVSSETTKARPEQPVADSKIRARLNLIAPILISTALNVIGQIILKQGMKELGPISLTDRGLFDILLSIATNPFIIVGMAVFAASVLFWLVGLSRVPLSFAYPFVSLSFVMIVIGSALILGESVKLVQVGGVGVICLGVLLVAAS